MVVNVGAMLHNHPPLFPWLPEAQIYGNIDSAATYAYSSQRRRLTNPKCQATPEDSTIPVANRWEAQWDRISLGQLRNYRSATGHPIDDVGSHDDEGEPTFVYSVKFCPTEHGEFYLALANEEGNVSIIDTSSHACKKIEFGAHDNAIFDMAWVPQAMNKIVTVSGDMTARLWDINRYVSRRGLEYTDAKDIGVFSGYNRSVKCVEFRPDRPDEFATGSRENAIHMWDIRDPSKPTNVIREVHTLPPSTQTSFSCSLATRGLSRYNWCHSQVISDKILFWKGCSFTRLPLCFTHNCLFKFSSYATIFRRRTSRANYMRPRQGVEASLTGEGNTGKTIKGSVTALVFQDENTIISASDSDGIIKASWELLYTAQLLLGDISISDEYHSIQYIYYPICRFGMHVNLMSFITVSRNQNSVYLILARAH